MADTYADLWRSLRLHVPQLPPLLAQRFIKERYRQICERGPWSRLRTEIQLLTNVVVSAGTVAVTRGSLTVTGTGTAWAAIDVGRQFQVSSISPTYTITAVDVGPQTLTLNLVYGATTATGASYRILDGYVSMPADFMRWLVLVDPQRGWRIRHWVTQEELSRHDPQRINAGDPWVLVDRAYSSAGLIQFEWWPYPTTARPYVGYYIKRAADLVNPTDTPIWPLRGDEILKGALVDVCKWPGTSEQPNPLFGQTQLMRTYEAEFQDLLIELERQDQDIASTWYTEVGWADWPFAPLDAKFLQNHSLPG